MPWVHFDTIVFGTTDKSVFQQYQMNSLFDPGQVLSSTQPLGFDQYASLFQRYMVYGNRCSVNFVKQGSAPGIGWVHMIADDDIAITYGATLPTELMSRPQTTTKQIYPTGSDRHIVTLKKYYRMRSLAHQTTNISNFGALVGANPNLRATLNVGCSTFNGDVHGGTETMNLRIKMTFYVMMYDPIMTLNLS